jgi:hypothetical protein
MSSQHVAAMRNQNSAKFSKEKTRDEKNITSVIENRNKRAKMTTKEHLIEQAALARYKLKKEPSQGNVSPWIIGESYKVKIPEDDFEV